MRKSRNQIVNSTLLMDDLQTNIVNNLHLLEIRLG